MKNKKKTRTVKEWDMRGEKPLFNPVVPIAEIDFSHDISPRAPFKMLQVVENARLNYMFAGIARILAEAGIEFEQLHAGEFILLINRARDYVKLLIGNGTPSPIIAAYRFPKGVRLPSAATKEVVRSFLKKGDIQADERLKLALGESLRDTRRRYEATNGKTVK